MSEQGREKEPIEKKLGVEFPSSLKGGVYSNSMSIGHTREEFIMDFMMIAPPAGAVTARIIMSPGHLKRVISALQNNLGKYEKKFGPIEVAAEPPASKGKKQATSTPINELMMKRIGPTIEPFPLFTPQCIPL